MASITRIGISRERIIGSLILTVLTGTLQELFVTIAPRYGSWTWDLIPKIPLIIWVVIFGWACVRIFQRFGVRPGFFLMACAALGIFALPVMWLSPGMFVRLDLPYYGVSVVYADTYPSHLYDYVSLTEDHLYTADGLVARRRSYAYDPANFRHMSFRTFSSWQAGVAAGYLPDYDYVPEGQSWRPGSGSLAFALSVGPLALADALIKAIWNRLIPLMLVQLAFCMKHKYLLWWDENGAPINLLSG